MSIDPCNASHNEEKRDTTSWQGCGDAIRDIDSRTTTLVNKEPDRMYQDQCSLQLGANCTAQTLSAAEIEREISETITIPCRQTLAGNARFQNSQRVRSAEISGGISTPSSIPIQRIELVHLSRV